MVNMPNCADVDVGLLPLELTSGSTDGEAPTWGGGGRGGGRLERGGEAGGEGDV